MDKMQFPKDFYWGAATSSHQVEGNNVNDWSEWEKSELRIKNLESRIKDNDFRKNFSEYIFETWPSPLDIENYISSRACDHYNRYEEDFDIAKSLGHNAHRFSIEWSRIEPEEGKWNEKEIKHYQKVIAALRSRGLEPFVTLWHWPVPIWIYNQGSWENKKTIQDFSKYCERIASEFKNEVKYWMILNEPEYWFGNAYVIKKFPVPRQSFIAGLKAYRHLVLAHKLVYQKLKKINNKFCIGIVESTSWIAPEPLRWFLHDFRNFVFPWLVRDYFDFFGLNYYRRTSLISRKNREIEMSDIGWEIYPAGLYKMLKSIHWRFGKPIYITENGIADAEDKKREKFIKDHLYWVAKAIGEGVDIKGYFHWSLLDNFEWDKGFWPRFGLVEVDYKTMERKVRASALEYAKIIDSNRE